MANTVAETITAAVRPRPILEHSESRIGQEWTVEDHLYLRHTIRLIEETAEAIARRGRLGDSKREGARE